MKHPVAHSPSLLAALALGVGASSLAAQTVFTSNFDSRPLTTGSRYLILESNAQNVAQVWLRPGDFTGTAGTGSGLYSIISVDNHPTNRALQVRRSGADLSTALYFPAQTLAVGESLRMETLIRYRFENESLTAPDLAQALRFGFGNIVNTSNLDDPANSAFFIRTNPGLSSTTGGTSAAFNLPATNNFLSTTSGNFTATSGATVSSTNFNAQSEWQSLSLTLTRNATSWTIVAEGAVNFTGTTDNVAGMPTAFNVFGLRMAGHPAGTLLQFDDMTISVIPEPSAFAGLAGLGALGFAALRRRRG